MFFRKIAVNGVQRIFKRFNSGQLTLENQSVQKYLHDLKNEFDLMQNSNKSHNRLQYLTPIMHYLNQIKEQQDNLQNLESLIKNDDYEFRKLAIAEKEVYEESIRDIECQLIECLLPNENRNNSNGIVLEVKSGVGGQEAMLFSRELVTMYTKFSDFRGFNYEIVDLEDSEGGGVRNASLVINDPDAYQCLQYEAGVHRVQRVPKTDKSGRMHTSTVSVAVLPQPSEIEVIVDDKDLKWETKKASGAGGQHVNTTESAIRLTHLPTGLTTECQTSRSQHKNREHALKKIKAQLYDIQLKSQQAELLETRKSQVQSNNRNEKIRTYNFPQDRITDHRVQFTVHNLRNVFDGDQYFNAFLLKLDREIRYNSLLQILQHYQ